jgi:DNA-binding beta-propeller fold protein YncE
VKPLDGQGRLHFPELLALNPSGGMTVVAEPGEHRLQVFVNREHPSTSRVNDVPWWDGLHARLHALRLAPPPTGAPPQVFAAVAAVDVHAVYFFDVSSAALGPLATLGGFGRKLGELNHVAGVASDSSRGRAWVSDRGNRRLQLLELQRDGERPELFSGIVRVVATRAIDAFLPGRLALDAANQLYLLDRSRGEIQVYDAAMEPVRRIPVGFGVVDFAVNRDGRPVVLDAWRCELRTLEADGKPRSSFGRRGETGDDAFLLPGGVAVDDQGLVYVTDQLLHDVRKFDPAGKLLARWGKPGRFVETLWGPRGVAVEKPGRVVVEDVGNHRAAVFATDGRYLGAYVTGGLTSPMGIR